MQAICKADIKSLILPQLTSKKKKNTWILYCLLYVLKESEVVTWKSSIKKVFLKIPQNTQENIFAKVSFAIKLLFGGLQLH